MIKNNKEKGFALVLSIILLIVMSLMGGSLIVISSGDHQSNNSSDQYQQTFYVAEAGLLEGEKWILDKYLGPWMNSMPSDSDVLGDPPEGPGELAVWNVKNTWFWFGSSCNTCSISCFCDWSITWNTAGKSNNKRSY